MAKPDLDDGYLRVAHELFAAIACAGFNKWEMVVLREVFDQIYGPQKAKTAKLSASGIAGRAGTFKESITRANRSLVSAGVLRKIDDGEFAFVKDYERWKSGDQLRLTEREIAYCKSARRIIKSKTMGNESVPISKFMGNESVPPGERNGSLRGTDLFPQGNETVPLRDVPPRPPIEDRVRDKKEEELEEEREAPALAPTLSLPPEYTKVGELAAELGGDVSWSMWVVRMGQLKYPAAWIQDVVEKMAARGEMNSSLGYGILRRYKAQGGPDKPASFSRNGHSHGPALKPGVSAERMAELSRPVPIKINDRMTARRREESIAWNIEHGFPENGVVS